MDTNILLLLTIEFKHQFQILFYQFWICYFLWRLSMSFVKLIDMILFVLILILGFIILVIASLLMIGLVLLFLCLFIMLLVLLIFCLLYFLFWFLLLFWLFIHQSWLTHMLLSFHLLIFLVVLNCEHFIIFYTIFKQLYGSFTIKLRFSFCEQIKKILNIFS